MVIRMTNTIGCGCCGGAGIRCPNVCLVVPYNPDCPNGIKFYTVAMDAVWTTACLDRYGPRSERSPDGSDVYLLGYAGARTWERLHGYGGTSVRMRLSENSPLGDSGGDRCWRTVEFLEIRTPSRTWTMECRNGVTFVSERCAPSGGCALPVVAGFLIPRVWAYPATCAGVHPVVTQSGFAGTNCVCTLNRSMTLDLVSGAVTLDGNCVAGQWSKTITPDCGLTAPESIVNLLRTGPISMGCGTVDLTATTKWEYSYSWNGGLSFVSLLASPGECQYFPNANGGSSSWPFGAVTGCTGGLVTVSW